MKNILMVAALISLSAPAMASKARSTALGGSHTDATDVQDLFESPSKMFEVGDLVTIEYGRTGTEYAATQPVTVTAAENAVHAEGGFLRSHDNSKYGLYVGHQSASLLYLLNGGTLGTAMTANRNLRKMENPVNLFYGMKGGAMNWGLNVYYAASEKAVGGTANEFNKKSAMGVAFGASADKWNANAVIGLGAKVEANSSSTDQEEFKATSNFKVAGEYAMSDDMILFGDVTQIGGKHTSAAGVENSDLENMSISLGAESKVKSDMVHFFYGAMLTSATEKNKVTGATVEKAEAMLLPVYMGFEADAASWLVLRSSLKQNVLLDGVKTSSSTTTLDGTNKTDSTVATLGAGLKFGKLMIDGTTGIETNGKLDSSNLMTNVAATYNF